MTLSDGSVWRQRGGGAPALDPAPGQAVTIERAALGSYRLMLNRNLGFKVERLR